MTRGRPSKLKGARRARPAIDSLFVYGSLLDPIARERQLGRPVRCLPAVLRGYTRRHARYFYLYAEPGASTRGLVLTDLTRADLARLDAYEELAYLYTRRVVEVSGPEGRNYRCWVYLPTVRLLRGLSRRHSKPPG